MGVSAGMLLIGANPVETDKGATHPQPQLQLPAVPYSSPNPPADQMYHQTNGDQHESILLDAALLTAAAHKQCRHLHECYNENSETKLGTTVLVAAKDLRNHKGPN